ncbi:MAG TPA: AI-2E family transporter, partial [Mycobacteriales bacterium]|nr:AI-2E family transporter [Mycobacteriales bacterium]
GTTALGGVVGVGKVVFSAFFSTLTVLILTLYFLSSLPTIKAAAYRMIPRSRRARVGLLTDEILGRVGGYVGGALTIAATAGVTTFVLLAILGVDYPVALAMIVAVTSLVPLVGATIGAAIVVLVAFFTSVTAGVICAIFYLIYQQVENYVLYPKIMQRSVDVSPAATVVAVLIGGSLLGVLGALLAIPLAAAVQLVLQEVVAPRQENS